MKKHHDLHYRKAGVRWREEGGRMYGRDKKEKDSERRMEVFFWTLRTGDFPVPQINLNSQISPRRTFL